MSKFIKIIHLSILFIATSCGSHIDVSLLDDEVLGQNNSLSTTSVASSYSFSMPDKFILNSADTASITTTKLAGNTELDSSKLNLSTSNTASCDPPTITGAETNNPTITLTNCTGIGELTLSYGGSQSFPIFVNNPNGSLLSFVGYPVVAADKNTIYYIGDYQAIMTLDLTTGAQTVISSTTVGGGPVWSAALSSLAINNAETLAYTRNWDAVADELYRVDLTNGNRTLLSGPINGIGTDFDSISDIALNAAEDKIYLVDNGIDTLFEVDLTTGDRTVIADGTRGLGTDFVHPWLIANYSTSAVLVFDSTLATLFLVDKVSGDRTEVASASTGDGIPLNGLSDMVLSHDSLYLYGIVDESLIRIDLANGNRTVISDQSTGAGFNFAYTNSIALNSDSTFAYTSSTIAGGLMKVDLSTGDRTFVQTSRIGTGPEIWQVSSPKLSVDESSLFIKSSTSENKLLSINLATGARTEVSGDNVGGGVANSMGISHLTYNTTRTKAYASQFTGGMIEYDLTTGDRTQLTDGALLTLSESHHTNTSSTKSWVVESIFNTLVEVDHSDGSKAVITGNGNGSGTALDRPTGVAVNSAETFAYIYDLALTPAIIRVDLSNGARSILSNTSNGTGLDLARIANVRLQFNSDESQLLAISANGQEPVILQIDVVTGNRVIFLDDTTGTGPKFSNISGFTFNSDESKAYITDDGSAVVYEVDMATRNRKIISK